MRNQISQGELLMGGSEEHGYYQRGKKACDLIAQWYTLKS